VHLLVAGETVRGVDRAADQLGDGNARPIRLGVEERVLALRQDELEAMTHAL